MQHSEVTCEGCLKRVTYLTNLIAKQTREMDGLI